MLHLRTRAHAATASQCADDFGCQGQPRALPLYHPAPRAARHHGWLEFGTHREPLADAAGEPWLQTFRRRPRRLRQQECRTHTHDRQSRPPRFADHAARFAEEHL